MNCRDRGQCNPDNTALYHTRSMECTLQSANSPPCKCNQHRAARRKHDKPLHDIHSCSHSAAPGARQACMACQFFMPGKLCHTFQDLPVDTYAAARLTAAHTTTMQCAYSTRLSKQLCPFNCQGAACARQQQGATPRHGFATGLAGPACPACHTPTANTSVRDRLARAPPQQADSAQLLRHEHPSTPLQAPLNCQTAVHAQPVWCQSALLVLQQANSAQLLRQQIHESVVVGQAYQGRLDLVPCHLSREGADGWLGLPS